MKVILAIGHSQVESAIEKQLPAHCEVVGVATYREAILNKLRENPTTDAVLIRDNLQGEVKILTLIHQIRAEFSKCRIILMTKNREAGDPFLSAVVSYAVWDIILGYKVSVSHMIDYILNPRSFKDVERFQKRVLIDETTPTPEVSQEPQSVKTEVPQSSPMTATDENPSSSNEVSQPTPPKRRPAAAYPSQPQEGGVRKGSMREQLFKQMESAPASEPVETNPVPTDSFPTFEFKPESTPVFEPSTPSTPDLTNGFTFEPHSETNISNSMAHTFQSSPSLEEAPSFVLENPSVNPPVTPPTSFPTAIPTFSFDNSKPLRSEETSKDAKEPQPVKEPKEPKKAKLFSTKDIESIEKPLVGHRPAYNNKIKNSPIVMSLVGFKSGVGTSQTAFNLATHLAKHQNRVLYVELNDHSLPITYLYNLMTLKGGLEEALRAANSYDIQDFSAYVTRFKELKQTQRDKEMQALLKPYPDTLDMLTFSHFFVSQGREEYYPEQLKGVLSDLLLSEGYQYIILDVNVHSNPTLVSQALRSSKYICPVITQDMVSIGQTVESLKLIHQNQFPLHNKIQFLLNRYDSTCHNDKSILRWIHNEIPFKALGIWTIPEHSNAYNKANDKSKPVVLNSPPKQLLNAFETLHNYLKTM